MLWDSEIGISKLLEMKPMLLTAEYCEVAEILGEGVNPADIMRYITPAASEAILPGVVTIEPTTEQARERLRELESLPQADRQDAECKDFHPPRFEASCGVELGYLGTPEETDIPDAILGTLVAQDANDERENRTPSGSDNDLFERPTLRREINLPQGNAVLV